MSAPGCVPIAGGRDVASASSQPGVVNVNHFVVSVGPCLRDLGVDPFQPDSVGMGSAQWQLGLDACVGELGEAEPWLLVGSWFALNPGDRSQRAQLVKLLLECGAGVLGDVGEHGGVEHDHCRAGGRLGKQLG